MNLHLANLTYFTICNDLLNIWSQAVLIYQNARMYTV